MNDAAEIRLSARGMTLAGLRWNAGASCRVLAVHGWLDNAATFVELAPLLPDCDVVALDLPGHGHSSHRGSGTLQHFVEYIADVVAALDALGWEQAVLLGHSLGAGIMTCVSGTFPERAQGLLLLEGAAPQPAPPEKILESLRAAIEATQRGARESAGYEDMAAAIRARGKGFWPMSEAASRQILARALSADERGVLRWHTDPRLRQPSAVRLLEGQVAALMAAVKAPVLLVGATEGLFGDAGAHAARLAAFRCHERVVVPGGHHWHLEAETAPAVAEVLRMFLARHALTPG